MAMQWNSLLADLFPEPYYGLFKAIANKLYLNVHALSLASPFTNTALKNTVLKIALFPYRSGAGKLSIIKKFDKLC